MFTVVHTLFIKSNAFNYKTLNTNLALHESKNEICRIYICTIENEPNKTLIYRILQY